MSSTLADGYAAAFFEVAKAEGALGVIGNELASFANAYENSPQLQQALTDQAVPADHRQGIVEMLLGAKAHSVTTNLVSMVVGAGRARELPAVVSALLAKTAAEQGKASGEVRSAHPLTSEQQSALTAAVEKSTGKSVALTFLVDPSVLGGVVTTVGDIVIDGSIRNRLDQMKAAI
jgi:F-type H+-transporting ATPase subunit delta